MHLFTYLASCCVINPLISANDAHQDDIKQLQSPDQPKEVYFVIRGLLKRFLPYKPHKLVQIILL